MSKRIGLKWTLALAGIGLLASGAAAQTPEAANLDLEQGSKGWELDGKVWKVLPGCGRKGSQGIVWENNDEAFAGYAICKLPADGGGVYRVGGWIKVDRQDSKTVDPRIGFNLRTKGNKWLGAGGTSPVVENAANTDGWRYFECKTRALPGDAAFISVLCSVKAGSRGRIFFDDFTCRQTGTDIVGPMTSSRYRDEGQSGKVRVSVVLRINTAKHPLDTLNAVFGYYDTKRKLVEREADVFTEDHASVTLDIGDFHASSSPIVFEVRTKPQGTTPATKLGENVLLFTKGNLPKRHVSFDEYNRTLIDGVPFFPLGMYSHDRELGKLFFARYREAGFNCVMPYRAPTRKKLDEAWKAGIRVVYNVQGQIFGTPFNKRHYRTPQAVKALMGRTVNAVKDHPAVLAWYVNDECPEDDRPVLEDAYLTLHAIDDDHPTWAVTDKPYHARPFLGTYDVIGMDPYPIGNGRGGIDICTSWANEAFAGTFCTKPMWQVPQAFNWAWYRPTVRNPEHRVPTAEEFDNMTWQAIAAGANGLVYYVFEDIFTKQDPADAERTWTYMKKTTLTVRDRMPILLSKPGRTSMTFPKGVNARAWTTDSGETWVLAVNTTRERTGDFAPLESRFFREK